MTVTTRRVGMLGMLLWLGVASTASAQVFGTFSWQMQPFCNVVTLTITQIPGGFTIDGSDNQCGAAKLAGAAGMALVNPDGTVGLEFTIVTAPAGKALHVSASLAPATGSGPWTDSVGNSGTLALGANVGGAARPFPASGLGPSVVTTHEIAQGAVGGTDIDPAEVQARVSGTCPAGQAVSGVNVNGTVTCVATELGTQFRATSAVQTVANNVLTPVIFRTVNYNAGGGSYNAGNGVYTVPQAGTYLITSTIRWAPVATAAGATCIIVLRNSQGAGSSVCATPSTTTALSQNVSDVLSLVAGDLLVIVGLQTSGAAATLSGISSDVHFSVTRLR